MLMLYNNETFITIGDSIFLYSSLSFYENRIWNNDEHVIAYKVYMSDKCL